GGQGHRQRRRRGDHLRHPVVGVACSGLGGVGVQDRRPRRLAARGGPDLMGGARSATGLPASAVYNAPPVVPMTGLLWWFDADDAATITQTGGLVTQWNDKSGNGTNAVSGGSYRPT